MMYMLCCLGHSTQLCNLFLNHHGEHNVTLTVSIIICIIFLSVVCIFPQLFIRSVSNLKGLLLRTKWCAVPVGAICTNISFYIQKKKYSTLCRSRGRAKVSTGDLPVAEVVRTAKSIGPFFNTCSGSAWLGLTPDNRAKHLKVFNDTVTFSGGQRNVCENSSCLHFCPKSSKQSSSNFVINTFPIKPSQ